MKLSARLRRKLGDRFVERLLFQQEPLEAAAVLHEWVEAVDRAADSHGLERHSLIGERYLAVCGISTPIET